MITTAAAGTPAGASASGRRRAQGRGGQAGKRGQSEMSGYFRSVAPACSRLPAFDPTLVFVSTLHRLHTPVITMAERESSPRIQDDETDVDAVS